MTRTGLANPCQSLIARSRKRSCPHPADLEVELHLLLVASFDEIQYILYSYKYPVLKLSLGFSRAGVMAMYEAGIPPNVLFRIDMSAGKML